MLKLMLTYIIGASEHMQIYTCTCTTRLVDSFCSHHVVNIVHAESLPEVMEHARTVLLELEVTREVLP